MPATITTTEQFDVTDTKEDQLKQLIQLRLQAGAIRSTYNRVGDTWVLDTEWNVLGQQ